MTAFQTDNDQWKVKSFYIQISSDSNPYEMCSQPGCNDKCVVIYPGVLHAKEVVKKQSQAFDCLPIAFGSV